MSSTNNSSYPKEQAVAYPQEQFHIVQPTSPGTYLGPIDPSLPGADKIPLLFQPFKVKDLTLANRMIVAPMCMYSSKDGFMNSFHMAHLGSFAIHGAGLIICEASAVQPRGRISPQDVGIWSDDHIHKLKEVADMIHAQGSKMAVQLAHAGRKASVKAPYSQPPASDYWPDDVVSASGGESFRWSDKYVAPRELSVAEIEETVRAFGDAAVRAAKAGMDTVEIHGAHGYLIHNFLSPISNKRTDSYGGSLENRARFLLEIIKEVRSKFPAEKPIFLRISATDWVESVIDGPSWDIEQSVQVAKWAKEAGVDVIHVSTGGNVAQQQIKPYPGYQVPFAERIKREVPDLYVIAVGILTSGKQAEEILVKKQADLIAAAREFLREPSFVTTAAHELNVKVKFSAQYERARRDK
ncbi:hypothetical protein FBU30_000537 [Linnemannia zychae]|nr:hypothetical protein FBU30_000537 [Linnemannia zychae]